MMVHREDGNDQGDDQECVNVIRSFLARRINDPVAHGMSLKSEYECMKHQFLFELR